MKQIMIIRTILLIFFFLALSFTSYAHAQMFKYEMNPYSSVGKPTGGKCLKHEECTYGYKSKGKNYQLLCLNKKEAKGRHVADKHIPKNGLLCACLPDVKLCGFAYPEDLYQ